MPKRAPDGAKHARVLSRKEVEDRHRLKHMKNQAEASSFIGNLLGSKRTADKDQDVVVEERRSVSGSAKATKRTTSRSKPTKTITITPGKTKRIDSSNDGHTSEDKSLASAYSEDKDDFSSDDNDSDIDGDETTTESPKQQSEVQDLADILINKGGKLARSEKESLRIVQQHYNNKLATMTPSLRSGKKPTSSTKKNSKKNRSNGGESESDSEAKNTDPGAKNKDLNMDYKAMHQELHQNYREKEAEINESSWGKLNKQERKDRTNKAYQQLVKSQIINIWRTTKFINNEADLMEVTKKVISNCNLKEHNLALAKTNEEKEKVNKERAAFLALYKETVRIQINDKRSYVSNEARKRCFDFMDGIYMPAMQGQPPNLRELPTVEDLTRVVFRNLVAYKEEEQDEEGNPVEDQKKSEYLVFLFEWHVTTLLPCFAGNKWWGTEKFHKGCVSTLLLANSSEALMVPPSTEAFALVAYENCYQRWKALDVFRKQEKNLGKPLPKCCPKSPETECHKGKFSDGASGQARYGGWSNKGRNLFTKLKAKIADNRKENKDHIKALERVIQKKYLAMKNKSSKKRKAGEADLEEDDEEEEELLDNGDEELLEEEPDYVEE